MDSMIPIGQKNTLAEYLILYGVDNHPPMLDNDLTKKYVELSAIEKIQADSDLKETNIILQSLMALDLGCYKVVLKSCSRWKEAWRGDSLGVGTGYSASGEGVGEGSGGGEGSIVGNNLNSTPVYPFHLIVIASRRNKQEELFTHKEEMAPMALSDSKVNNDKSCSKTCLPNSEALKKQYDDLLVKLSDTDFKAATYKRGLATLEGQIVKYREHKVCFSEEIALLKRSVGSKEYQMRLLRDELEKVKQEKEGFEFKIAKFNKSAKDISEMLKSQITDKSKTGVDLSYSGLDEFKEPEFKGYGPENSKKESNVYEVESPVVVKKKTVFPTAAKIEFVRPKQHEKPVRKPVKYAEMYRSQKPRGNQRNWNNLKSQQLGNEFVMNNKACFACGSFNHLIKDCKRKVQKPIWNNARRVNHHNSHRMSYPHPKRNFVPKAVLMKTGMRPVNAAKPKAAYNAVKRNRFNAVKASACWVWMPKNRVVDHVSKNISASVTLKRLDYIDAQGRFKCINSGEARVQQRKRRIQRRVQQEQKDQEDEVFGRILSAKKIKTIEELTTAGYRVTTAGSRFLLLAYRRLKLMMIEEINAD
ncbi:ribonuclease H-like domain-containing protein [Tanacetum coccineum]|uniref:Ribonuclease H-like domain-containing protein n=1 Tax=Tanacetum coccineum TaxID=301880 RepID=A0ABQ5E7Y7_9ASTR